MMLTQLATVLRARGLDVVEAAGWTSRGHGPMLGVETVVCHHTAGPATGDPPSLRTVIDGRPGLAGPLANLYLSRSGAWYTVAAGKAWHAGAVLQPSYSNDYAVGIEAEATGTASWPPAQYESFAIGCAALAAHYGLPVERVMGHKEVCAPPGRKIDPNFAMEPFRALIAHYLEVDVPLTAADIDLLLREPLQRHVNEAKVNVPDALTVGEALATLYVRSQTAPAPGSVDPDAVAAKVADVLAARLAS